MTEQPALIIERQTVVDALEPLLRAVGYSTTSVYDDGLAAVIA